VWTKGFIITPLTSYPAVCIWERIPITLMEKEVIDYIKKMNELMKLKLFLIL
jgi:hypothetical protein